MLSGSVAGEHRGEQVGVWVAAGKDTLPVFEAVKTGLEIPIQAT